MAALLYTEGAREDMHRRAEFLQKEDPAAAGRTAALLIQGMEILESHPLMGRPLDGETHELMISRGRSGYVAVYQYQEPQDRVLVLAIRHQSEAGV